MLTPWRRDWMCPRVRWGGGFEQFPADGRREELGVRTFRDRGVGMAEELADRFEAEAPVDEVAAEGASERVRADGGSVLAGARARAAAGVTVLARGAAAAGDRSDAGLVGDTFDYPPHVVRRHGRAMLGCQKGCVGHPGGMTPDVREMLV